MKKRKNKAQQAVAAVVMGMNLVNTMSPLALAAQAPLQPEAMRPAPQAQPLEYTVLPQFLQAVEGMAFARAEAAPQNITVNDGESSSADSFSAGDAMSINSGGTGSIGTMNNGTQIVSSGGFGSIETMNSGGQGILSGATGSIATMNSGVQNISSGGGTGIIGTVINGSQYVITSGYGSIGILNGSNGLQEIYMSGVGVIGTMNDGLQYEYGGGTCIIGTMESGVQRGWLVHIDTINNGSQEINMSSGVGSIGTMNGGMQTVNKGATGNIGIMNGGSQHVDRGTGIIDIMNDGQQRVSKDLNNNVGTGIIGTMNGGMQEIINDVGSIGIMNNGMQSVSAGASGSIDTMNNGMQSGSGNMSISVMNGGTQSLTFAATGNIGVMNDGEQQIGGTAVGIISSLNGGTQILNGASATAKDTIINGGVQLVQNGTAQDNTVNGGTQIISGGVVSDNIVNAGVMLFENSAATVNNVTMNGGEMLFGSANAYSITSLNFNGGTVDLTENASTDYQTLTLENYSGSGGTFKLDADFAAVSGDKVEITSANNAAGYIQVNGANIDASTISEDNPLLLVTVNNGSATFTGKSLNGGGLYEYNPEIAEGDEINQNPNEFYLTGLTKNVNNDTLALLDGT